MAIWNPFSALTAWKGIRTVRVKGYQACVQGAQPGCTDYHLRLKSGVWQSLALKSFVTEPHLKFSEGNILSNAFQIQAHTIIHPFWINTPSHLWHFNLCCRTIDCKVTKGSMVLPDKNHTLLCPNLHVLLPYPQIWSPLTKFLAILPSPPLQQNHPNCSCGRYCSSCSHMEFIYA